MKINKKRLIMTVLILIVIICIIVFALMRDNKNNNVLDNDVELNGSKEIKDDGDIEDLEGSSQDDGNNNEIEQITIPFSETTSVDDYVDNSGKKLSDEEMAVEKEKISQKFKSLSNERLKLDVDMSTVKLMYSQGTNTIDGNICYVFSVYVPKDDVLAKVGTYAISTNLNILYYFDSETMVYKQI